MGIDGGIITAAVIAGNVLSVGASLYSSSQQKKAQDKAYKYEEAARVREETRQKKILAEEEVKVEEFKGEAEADEQMRRLSESLSNFRTSFL